MKTFQLTFIVVCLLTGTQSHSQTLTPEETEFHSLINRFRGLLGLPGLKIHPALQTAASLHSEWMAENEILSHNGPTQTKTPFQRMEEAGYQNPTSMGENVACGNANARKTFLQWAFSPGHLANMLSPNFRDMGIARRGTGLERCPYYWTHDLAATTDWKLDPPRITDAQRIQNAIRTVAGPFEESEDSVLPQVQ